MSQRKDKLEKALATPENLYNYPWQDGAEWESKRLAPLHSALLDAIEALEFYQDESYSLREGYVIAAKDGLCDYASGKTATEALAKIDKVLGEEK